MDLEIVNLICRVVQFLCAVIACWCASAGFSYGKFDYTSFHATFGFLVANGVMICIAVPIWGFFVEFKHMINPPAMGRIAFDAIFFIFSLSGAIAGATSQFITGHCAGEAIYDTNNEIVDDDFNCHTLKASLAFTFFCCFLFAVTLGFAVKNACTSNGNETSNPNNVYHGQHNKHAQV